MNICKKCGTEYNLHPDCEPSSFCDTCAQEILFRLEQITPEPPKAITWEVGNKILDLLQDELYSKA